MKTPRVNLPEKSQATRIFLIDDHEVVRDGLRKLLDDELDFTICGEASSSKTALAELEKVEPDLALVDISMPGASGLELIKGLKARFPALRMIVLSMYDEALYAERVIRAGAGGYVMKRGSFKELIGAIRTVLRGEIYLSASLSSRLLQTLAGRGDKMANPLDQLSDREIEVLRLVGDGFTTREVASSLGISLKTVESHRGNMRQKLKFKTGAELTRFAISNRQDSNLSPQSVA